MKPVPGVVDYRSRRIYARHRCLLACRIVFGVGGLTADAVLRDRSASGARLRLNSPLPLPRHFQVLFAKDGECFEAELIWRRGIDLGVRLHSPIDINSPTDASIRLLRRIWAEMPARSADFREAVR